VGIVGRNFETAAIAKVCPVFDARNSVGTFVNHVIARFWVILLDNLEATRATSCSVRLPPLLDVILSFHRAIDANVPSYLALHAKSLAAVRAGNHHASHSFGENHKVATEDASHAVSKDSPIVK